MASLDCFDFRFGKADTKYPECANPSPNSTAFHHKNIVPSQRDLAVALKVSPIIEPD